MTTPLTRTVARKANGVGPNRREYVVTIGPGDVIGFRDVNCRRVEWLPLRYCYEQAIKARVAAERHAKKKARAK